MGLLRSLRLGFVFSSLAVNRNVRTLPHVDRNNLSSEPNLVVSLTKFNRGGRLHCTMPWRGMRIVLIGFTVRSTEKLSESQCDEASALGFVLPPKEEPSSQLGLVASAPRAVRAPKCLSSPRRDNGRPRRSHQPLRIDPFGFSVGSSAYQPAFTSSHSQPHPLSRAGHLPGDHLAKLSAVPPGRFVYSSPSLTSIPL